LFIRTLHNLRAFHPGFDASEVLLVELEGAAIVPSRELLDDVLRLPGIVSAALTTHTPMSGSLWSEPAVPAGQPLPERDTALFVAAGPRFFETLQIPVLAGREFTDRDVADGPSVAIINDAYAKRFFPNRPPLGERLAASVSGERRDLEIVGLVQSVSASGLRTPPAAAVYVPHSQMRGAFPTTVVVRATGPLDRAAAAIQQALQPRAEGKALGVQRLSTRVSGTIVQERMMATLASGFGLLALALVSVGIYGLLAYTVAQRTREIAIRLALGARPPGVVGMVVLRGSRLVAVGIAVGLPVAWAGSRWVKSMLFGLTPFDPVALGSAIMLLALAAQLAAYIPARRASRVDPLTALRHE
jgi:predicted permease